MQILYQEPIMIYNPVYLYAIICVIILCVVLCSLFGSKEKWGMLCGTFFISIFTIILLCCAGDAYQIQSGKHKYYVVFNNDYDMTQVYQNYDVIMQRGLLWIIKETDKYVGEF